MVQYKEDLYAWSRQTATALLEGRFEEIDVGNVAEEILDLGSEKERQLESRMMQIMLHLLKMRYQPGKHTRSWDLSVKEQRLRVKRLLDRNPSLRAQGAELYRMRMRWRGSGRRTRLA